MAVAFGPQSALVQLVWSSPNFATGGGTTTFGFNVESAGTLDLGALLNTVRDAWTANVRTITDSNYTLERLRCETFDRSLEVGASLAGTGSINSPASNTSILISYKGYGKGPRWRGRSYWPGLLPEGDVDERGAVLSSRVVALQTAMGAFWTAVEANPQVVNQAIVQSTYPGQKTPPNDPWPAVIERAVQGIAATQRRRMRR
jgi:hypothetical protein